MANHFYAMNPGDVFSYDSSTVAVATTTNSAYFMELRVTDDEVTAQQIYEFLEKLADYFAANEQDVVVPGTLTG